MRRRALLLASATLLAPVFGVAQPEGKIYRIGVHSRYVPRERFALIPTALRELGWVEGRNVRFEYRFAEGQANRLPGLAKELVGAQVDLIIALANDDILAAKQATTSIPIVMVFSLIPVEMGFVDSLARPGGNITGTTIQAPETAGKMFEVLGEAVPQTRHVAVIWEEGFPGMDAYRRAGEVAIAKLGMRWTLYPVHVAADLDAAFAQIPRARPDALYVVPTGAIYTHRARVIEFAARERLPAIYTSDAMAVEGGLIAYTADTAALAARASTYIDRILRGARPADLPVEQPAKYNLVVNLSAAKAIGLKFPQSILLRADLVIE
jgi:putative ABC transport system substrate-binding protein